MLRLHEAVCVAMLALSGCTSELGPSQPTSSSQATPPAAAAAASGNSVVVYLLNGTQMHGTVVIDMFAPCGDLFYTRLFTPTGSSIVPATWVAHGADVSILTYGLDIERLYVCPRLPGTVGMNATIQGVSAEPAGVQIQNTSSVSISGPTRVTSGGLKTWTPAFSPAAHSSEISFKWGFSTNGFTPIPTTAGIQYQLDPAHIYGNFKVAVFAYRYGTQIASAVISVGNLVNGPH